MSVASYPRHTDTSVPWVPSLPEHWDLIRLKDALAALLSGGTPDSGDESFWADDVNGIPWVAIGDMTRAEVVKQTEKRLTCLGQTVKKIPLLPTGTLLYSIYASLGKVAVLGVPATTNQAILGILPDTKKLDERFLMYWLKHFERFLGLFATSSTQLNLNAEKVRSFAVAKPPLEEQSQIAKFLDYETAKMDALIKKQQQLIALLKEKREGLLHVAISEKGAEKVRLEHCWERVSRPISRLDDEIYYPIGLLNRGRGIFHKDPTLGCDLGDSEFFYVEEGDLILSGQFAWEGAVALAGEEESGCVATHRYPVVRGRPGVTETAFLWALFASQTGDFLLNESSRGAAGRNRPLNMNSLSKEKILVPSLGAQRAVAKLVFREKALRARIQQPIALLQERRTALISAAVTGKIDVRGWKAPKTAVEAETA